MSINSGQLKSVYLHITEKCEHQCEFCYAIHGLGGFVHADFAAIKRIIDLVAEAGVTNLSLVGGNPVLHPQIMDILRYVRSSTSMKIILMTNTACIPNAEVKEVAPFVDVVMVTIHGDNATQHDSVTKCDGSYSSLISNIKAFQDNGVAVEIAYNITPQTFDHIATSIEVLFAAGINVKRYVLQRIAPVLDKDGHVVMSNEEYTPKKSQINIAMTQIAEVKARYGIPVELVDPFPLCVVDEKHHSLITPCKCGLTDMSINGSGDVTRCGADPNYQLGNILGAVVTRLTSCFKSAII